MLAQCHRFLKDGTDLASLWATVVSATHRLWCVRRTWHFASPSSSARGMTTLAVNSPCGYPRQPSQPPSQLMEASWPPEPRVPLVCTNLSRSAWPTNLCGIAGCRRTP